MIYSSYGFIWAILFCFHGLSIVYRIGVLTLDCWLLLSCLWDSSFCRCTLGSILNFFFVKSAFRFFVSSSSPTPRLVNTRNRKEKCIPPVCLNAFLRIYYPFVWIKIITRYNLWPETVTATEWRRKKWIPTSVLC